MQLFLFYFVLIITNYFLGTKNPGVGVQQEGTHYREKAGFVPASSLLNNPSFKDDISVSGDGGDSTFLDESNTFSAVGGEKYSDEYGEFIIPSDFT